MADTITLPPPLAFIMGVPMAPRQAVEATLQAAIDALDQLDGDPDEEPNGDDEAIEANGDVLDGAYIEWTTMRGAQKRGPNILPTYNEDDEEDDPPEDDDPAGGNVTDQPHDPDEGV